MRYIELFGLIVLALAIVFAFCTAIPYFLSSGSIPLMLIGVVSAFSLIAFSATFLIKQIISIVKEQKDE